MKSNDLERINFLDGLRGIAIILVILFHAYSRWPDLYPYKNSFQNFLLFRYGWMGVELFFLISGFVILMTLEKCSSFSDFITRRWLRLFPAMFICSFLIYLSVDFFYERPAGKPNYLDILPGIMFIHPSAFKILKLSLKDLEGAFWSLYVEVSFYFTFGILYWFLKEIKAIFIIILLFLITFAINYYSDINTIANLAHKILRVTGFIYFGWFASGSLFYKFHKSKKPVYFFSAILIGIFSSFTFKGLNISTGIIGSFITVFFASSLVLNKLKKALSCRVLLFLGFISYPLYLIHENMMVSMIIKVGNNWNSLNSFFVPLFPILTVIAIGSILAFYIEPYTKKIITPFYKKIRIVLAIEKTP